MDSPSFILAISVYEAMRRTIFTASGSVPVQLHAPATTENVLDAYYTQ